MCVNFEAAIKAVASLYQKPMQGRPNIQLDFEKTLPDTGDDLWSHDVLGEYNCSNVSITLYIKAIEQAAIMLKVREDDLCLVVFLHELGHWLCHMALDEQGNNWQNYGTGVPDCRETLAQHCVFWAAYADGLQVTQVVLHDVLFKLMKKQSSVYQLDRGKCWKYNGIISENVLNALKIMHYKKPHSTHTDIEVIIENTILLNL